MKYSVVRMWLDATLSGMLVKLDTRYSNFLMPDGTLVVKLKRALYGCVESAKLWYEHISTTLRSFDFIANPQDKCVINLSAGGVQCTVYVYVDDLLITCRAQARMDAIIWMLIRK